MEKESVFKAQGFSQEDPYVTVRVNTPYSKQRAEEFLQENGFVQVHGFFDSYCKGYKSQPVIAKYSNTGEDYRTDRDSINFCGVESAVQAALTELELSNE